MCTAYYHTLKCYHMFHSERRTIIKACVGSIGPKKDFLEKEIISPASW